MTLPDPCLATCEAQSTAPRDQLQPGQVARSSTSSSQACMQQQHTQTCSYVACEGHLAGPHSLQLISDLLANL